MNMTRRIVGGDVNGKSLGNDRSAEEMGKNNTDDEGVSLIDLCVGLLSVEKNYTEMRQGSVLKIRSKLANSEVEIKFLYVGKHRG
ncbi:MAG TPA: hypothetical protein VFI02_13140 [Armatimonadota bacterium]|nr:hypothetical protein [Armatimonadota bacterium]